ncbi:MAG TPA: class I SAM-dependent methyltransferase [Tepidisphaeraceae bacterium]|nr:class I SAM-dependent methyltransferase [Tepidisphaeraceae bacterium]
METPPPPTPSGRPYKSSEEMDAAELAWWEKFSGIEEQFAWVQTPPIQRFLRGRYVRRIIELTPPGGRIADLGCGMGWLAVLLGKMGARQVVGIDFSPAQIARARMLAAESGVADRVVFEVGSAAELASRMDRFDVVILHAFLHHLSVSEIQNVLDTARFMLDTGGRLVIFEPVQYPFGQRHILQKALVRLLFWLAKRSGLAAGLGPLNRRPKAEEQSTRELFAKRSAGIAPHGPSPKEMPFAPDEIQALVAERFRIVGREPCMSISHHFASENLLMELSSPKLARALRWPTLALARTLESLALRFRMPPAGLWIFEMFVCEPYRPKPVSNAS